MMKVRRVITTSGRNRMTRHHNWRIEQETIPGTVRVFIYSNFRYAIANATRIANSRPISTFGLRGFHIEYRSERRVHT